MQGVSLASRPCASGPDDVFSRRLPGDVGNCLVVAQRVEVMFVEARAPRAVNPVDWSALAEIYLDRSDTHLQKILQLSLIPLHRRGIAHVEHRILKRQLARLVPDGITLRDDLLVELILGREIC